MYLHMLSKGQGQVTKGHDNEGSHLSGVAYRFGTILAVEADGGIHSNAQSHFYNWKRT